MEEEKLLAEVRVGSGSALTLGIYEVENGLSVELRKLTDRGSGYTLLRLLKCTIKEGVVIIEEVEEGEQLPPRKYQRSEKPGLCIDILLREFSGPFPNTSCLNELKEKVLRIAAY